TTRARRLCPGGRARRSAPRTAPLSSPGRASGRRGPARRSSPATSRGPVAHPSSPPTTRGSRRSSTRFSSRRACTSSATSSTIARTGSRYRSAGSDSCSRGDEGAMAKTPKPDGEPSDKGEKAKKKKQKKLDRRGPVRYDASLLGDQDFYLFNEGNHVRLFDKLGAHPGVVEGDSGV